MKKIIIATFILFPGFRLLGQDSKFVKEINEQVLMTFIKPFGGGDEEQFKSVHIKDVVRVVQDDGEFLVMIVTLKKYRTA